MKLAKGDKVAIVCCSNGQSLSKKKEIENLKGFPESGSPLEKARELMEFYEDASIKAIFDISGGDLANTILPYLDYERIASVKKQFCGYSDLTTIINAIYAKTQKVSVLYQIRNLYKNVFCKRLKQHNKQ